MKSLDLLKIEILKYKDNALVQLLLLFYSLLMMFAIFVFKNIDNVPVLGGNESFFQFPTIWEYQAYGGSWLAFIFLGYLGVFLVTSEFDFKTLRQNIITGYSRKDFFLAKLLVAITVSVFATLVFYLSSSVIGMLHQDVFSIQELFDKQEYIILRFFLMTFAYISFGMLCGYLLRKGGLAMFSYFSYILFIEPLFRWWFHYKVIDKGNTMLYYPMNAIEDLTPLPFYKYISTFTPVKDFNILLSYTEAGIISTVSVAVFIVLSYLLISKRDL